MFKVIGRNLLGAVDVGDCIFSHMFGAYFGLSISKVHQLFVDEDIFKKAKNLDSDYHS